MPDAFCKFFIDKVSKIRIELDSLSSNVSSPDSAPVFCDSIFSAFRPVSEEEVGKIIRLSKPTTCLLDPIPTPLLVECLDQLLPSITNIINQSLTSGVFPSLFKVAVVKPLLKKSSLDRNNLKNYRPVSNLAFFIKNLRESCFGPNFRSSKFQQSFT